MEVREALASDWPAVSALLAELGRPDVRGRDDEEDHRGRFEDYLARPDAMGLVAVDDGEVLGFIDVEFRQRLNFAEEEAWVPDLVVAEASRSRGAGRALLAEALERARERGCFALESSRPSGASEARVLRARGDDALGPRFHQAVRQMKWPPPPR